MTEPEIFKLLDGLFAYYDGFTDSGIKDEVKKQELKGYLQADTDRADLILGRFVREYYLRDDEIIKGYGLGSIKEFFDFLSDELGIDY